MKKLGLILVMVLFLLPVCALADDAGVLTEQELNQWVSQAVARAQSRQPMNAPVGEESLTEDGYAFIFDFATFYYDKPVLDEQSVLKAFVLTDGSYADPRGLKLDASLDSVMAVYGWQNRELQGDDDFAALYVENDLPQSAYWAWAQRAGHQVATLRCAVHVRLDEDVYTDSGLLYTFADGKVTAIRAYGLSERLTRAEVEDNLMAVRAVQEAAGTTPVAQSGDSNLPVSDAEMFSQSDLEFMGINYLTLDEAAAEKVFGPIESEDWVQDDTGEWLHTTHRGGLTLTHVLNAEKTQSHLEMLSASFYEIDGPRGIRLGSDIEEVIGLFRCDGQGRTQGAMTLLYGDGINPPYGALEQGGGSMILRYATLPEGSEKPVTLYLSFIGSFLSEMMLYSW